MPDSGGPNTVGEDTSHGDIRCDDCGTVILKEVERTQTSDIEKAIKTHHTDSGCENYSFYGRTKMEA